MCNKFTICLIMTSLWNSVSMRKSDTWLKNKVCLGCYDPISSNHSAETCTKKIILKIPRTIIQLLNITISKIEKTMHQEEMTKGKNSVVK